MRIDRHLSRLTLVAAVAVTGSSAFAEAAGDRIEVAVTQYQTRLAALREAGERPVAADLGDLVDDVLKEVRLDDLTIADIDRLADQLPIGFSQKTRAALIQISETRAKQSDASGAEAAALRVKLSRGQKPADRLPLLKAALEHPGLRQSLSGNSKAAELFVAAAEQPGDELRKLAPAFVAQVDVLTPEVTPQFVERGAGLVFAASDKLGLEGALIVRSLRLRLLAIAEQHLTSAQAASDSSASQRLVNTRDRLAGAFARGELLDHAAPPIEFLSFYDPADPSRTAKSLADFKGKVVVLDFWATWCGPCIASFPKIKAVQRYYRGFDVQVLGVTSVQGFHVGKGGRVDTKGSPQQEVELVKEFATEREVTWPLAFSTRNVFDPEFGIVGIPHVVIIDAKGIVRHRGVSAHGPLEEKTKLIDALLAENGSNVPAVPVLIKKPE